MKISAAILLYSGASIALVQAIQVRQMMEDDEIESNIYIQQMYSDAAMID